MLECTAGEYWKGRKEVAEGLKTLAKRSRGLSPRNSPSGEKGGFEPLP